MLNPIQREAKNEAAEYFGQRTISAAGISVGSSPGNIIGLGIGAKAVDSVVPSNHGVVRVYVQELPEPTVPERFGYLPTEVIEVGKIVAYGNQELSAPVFCGVSVGHPNVSAGTLGCLVERDGNHYILSNNHVLADTNAANPGDPVIQPGSADGGTTPDDNIATLEPYRTIEFEGPPNDIDAAIALVGDSNQTLVSSEIIDIGNPGTTPGSISLNQRVQKGGRTTAHTVGEVDEISADIWVLFREGYAFFENQIGIKSVNTNAFSAGGDSGSLIIDEQTQAPIGLLFAASDFSGSTFANPIDAVLNYYNVTIVGEQGVDA